MNSLLVGYLAHFYSILSKQENKIIIFGVRQHMQDVINMVGLHMIIDCVDTLNQTVTRREEMNPNQ